MSQTQEISRREFSKTLLAALGGGAIALLLSPVAASTPADIEPPDPDPDLNDVVTNPSGINQTILPLTDNIPLSLLGKTAGTSKLISLGNNGDASDRLFFSPAGHLSFGDGSNPLNNADIFLSSPGELDVAFTRFNNNGINVTIEDEALGLPHIQFEDSNAVSQVAMRMRSGAGFQGLDEVAMVSTGAPNLADRRLPFGDPGAGNAAVSFEFFSRNPDTQAQFEWLRFLVISHQEIDIQSLFSSAGVPMPIVFTVNDGNLAFANIESFRIKAVASGGADQARVSYATGKTPIQHNRGINEAAPGGAAVTKAITFTTAEENATYGVLATPHANGTVWVTNKLTTGFTLNYSVAGGFETDWMVFR